MIRLKKIRHKLEPLLPLLKSNLQKEEDILFGYIFGSYGKGKVTPLSDIDIAIYINEKKIKKDIFERKLELIDIITTTLKTDEIDLVILNEAPLTLIHQVLKTKMILFSKDEHIRIKFESKSQMLYFDTEPLRTISYKNLRKRIEEGKYGY